MFWLSINTPAQRIEEESAQRIEEATSRVKLIEETGMASQNDQKLFCRLVSRQRQRATNCDALYVNNELTTDDDLIREDFADYYEDLSSSQTEHTDEWEKALANMRKLCDLSEEGIVVSQSQVCLAIKQMSNKKAADKDGLSAEHLKLVLQSPTAVTTCTSIFNRIFKAKQCPQDLKLSAYKLPIPKKDKDTRLKDHYRGITVTSIFYKLMELLVQDAGAAEQIDANTSGLQFGFTEGRSPAMASLVVTEAIAESRESKTQLFIASLDARKAFDVVSQPILKMKLLKTRLKTPLWAIIDDLYTGSGECVRWKGIDSRTYPVAQGVKQGGILSPLLYKCYLNDLLTSMANAGLGLRIGGIYLGTPTVADDVLLLSSHSIELQGMLTMSYTYSTEHRYELHPQKSIVSPHTNISPTDRQGLSWYLGDSHVTVAEKFTHLGLDWKRSETAPDIEMRLKSARKTAYKLMGVGLHGHDGLDPTASLNTIRLYVLPRLLHGLEAAVLQKKDLSKLDNYYRRLLRQIQGLPSNVSSEAVYILLGTVPVEAHLHRRILSLLGSIARLGPSNPLYQLAVRQLAVKTPEAKSWFSQARRIGELYGIDIDAAVLHPWPKITWKTYVTTTITEHWRRSLEKAADSKSTLCHMLPPLMDRHQPHPMWTICRGSTYLTRATTVRARMLTGRYPVQEMAHRIYRRGNSSICPVCNKAPETLEHFVSICPAYKELRNREIDKLKNIYQLENLPPPETPSEIMSAVLNGGAYQVEVGSQHEIETVNVESVTKFKSLSHLHDPGLRMRCDHPSCGIGE